MARKRLPEEHENHERWLISYADFITLLFAFFVVMYAVSSVNEGKYRVLSDAMTEAFSPAARGLDPIQLGQQMRSAGYGVFDGTASVIDLQSEAPPTSEPPDQSEVAQDPNTAEEEPSESQGEAGSMARVVQEIARTLSTYIDQELVDIAQGNSWVEVEVKSSLLFASGSARVSPKAMPALKNIAAILSPLPNLIHVEGFTDNVPIDTVAYPSNWELSAARAASVVSLLSRHGVSPARMAATGYAEFRPVADNGTEEGRNQNRRVVLLILAGEDSRELLQQREAQRLPDLSPASASSSGVATSVGPTTGLGSR